MEERKERNTGGQKKRLIVPFVIALAGSLVLIVTLFLPFASATGDFRERLQEKPDDMYAEEVGMTNKEAIDLSLLEFGTMYAQTAKLGIQKSISITCLIIISVFAVLAILTTVFSLLKKPIAVIVFDLFSFGIFRVIMWDFDDRGVISNSKYDWGMAQYFCYIGAVVVLIGAIYLLVTKIKLKKEYKPTQNSDVE